MYFNFHAASKKATTRNVDSGRIQKLTLSGRGGSLMMQVRTPIEDIESARE